MQAADSSRVRPATKPANAAFAVRRVALETWLDARSDRRLRVVSGPAGCGKTTALSRWADGRPGGSPIWIDLAPDASPEVLLSQIIAALFAAATDGAARERLDVIVDGLDDVSPETADALKVLVFRVPANVHLIYVARSAAAIDVRDAERHRLVDFAPPATLMLEAADVAEWCDVAGVPSDSVACTSLADTTQGNAAEIAAVIRMAAERTLSLADAAALRRLRPAIDLRVPAVRRSAQSRIRGRRSIEPAIVEMFGRFRMRFGAREVSFVRRRDRQIVQYLALRAGGKASRAELMAEFWPDTDRRDAARRLRTACSTIRRAISACVGDDTLDAYFRTEGTAVVLCPENVINDADTFEEHIEFAQRASERGDGAVARRHVAAALRLHERPLLSGEPPAAWIAERARACEELATGARAFLYAGAGTTRIA